jgi:hypothetical protein
MCYGPHGTQFSDDRARTLTYPTYLGLKGFVVDAMVVVIAVVN